MSGSPALRVAVAPPSRLDGFIARRPLGLARRSDEFGNSGMAMLAKGRLLRDAPGVGAGAGANGDTHDGYTDLNFDF